MALAVELGVIGKMDVSVLASRNAGLDALACSAWRYQSLS